MVPRGPGPWRGPGKEAPGSSMKLDILEDLNVTVIIMHIINLLSSWPLVGDQEPKIWTFQRPYTVICNKMGAFPCNVPPTLGLMNVIKSASNYKF